jgi:hypothetical protein
MKQRTLNFWTGCARALAILVLTTVGLSAPRVRAQFAQGAGGGTALSFNGANAFAAVSNSAALNLYPLTVMGWFRSFDQGLDRGIVNKYVVNSFDGYNVYFHQGRIRAWYFRDSANFIWDYGRGLDSGFVAGLWLHFAFTVDASGGKLYVNGVLRDSRAWTGTPGPASQPQDVWLGRYANNFLNGQLDELSIWNVALSQPAIANSMNRRLEANEPGLLAYWRFSEGQGGVAADAVPTVADNNAATLFNGVSWAPSGAGVGPFVNTKGISGQTVAGGVNLSGEVNPLGQPTTAWFEWGTNTSYGNLTTPVNVGAASNFLTAGVLLSGLAQGQTYHYRYVATNLNGRANGDDQSFTQPVYPLPGGGPPLRSSAYDGGFASFAAFDARPEWDSSVAMTIEAWVYRQDANRFETIVSHDAPGSYWLGFWPRLRFYRGTNFVEAPSPVLAYKWTHVAVSYDGALARFYVNGELVGTRALSHTGAGKFRPLLLGHDDSHNTDIGPINRFMGNLDEVRVWSVARSAAEIRDGLYREVRGEPGLVAAFPRGGRVEEVSGLVGSVGRGVSEEIFGMVPRDLVVPRAAFPPFANGNIDLATEYLGAEQLVVRYPDQPTLPDTRAYFVHTDDDLFVAVAVSSDPPGDWNITNSWLSLYIDTTNAKPALAEYPQVQIYAQLAGNTNLTTLLNGDGAGSYYLCMTPPGIGKPQPCTPRSLWQVGQQFCGGEISTAVCTEYRVSRTLLGSFDEFDGVAIGQFNLSEFGEQTFIPEDGFDVSPATWLTMSYGQGSASVPRVRWSGRVLAGLTPNSPPLPGYRVSLIAGAAGASQLTDSLGRFSFDIPLPTNETIFAQAELEAFGRYTLPVVTTNGRLPQFVLTNRVIFERLPPDVGASVQLSSATFLVQQPALAAAIMSATPTNPIVGMAVRQGGVGGLGEEVTLFGTNLHAEMEFYLAPVSGTFPVTPEYWTLLEAPIVSRDANGNWVKVQAPFVPEYVREYTNGVFIPSFTSPWRWVAHDSWFRPGRIEYSYTGPFSTRRPPYPIVHGFHFKNDQTFPGLEEFLAAYGNNAYICVGAFDHCATHVPDPLYWILWYPVHFIVIAKSGGSCVGMSGTSVELYNSILLPQDYDPLALTANGINDHNLPGDWDTSNTGGIYTRPPIPEDAWARIRMNHGAQTSAEYMNHVISQLDVGVFSPHFGGNPVARLPELRAGTTAQAVCMVQGFDGGHCVTPYSVEDNYGGDPNLTRIWVYDNNKPCAIGSAANDPCVTSQFIDINHSANEYNFLGLGWAGTGLFSVPVSLYTGERTAPGLVDFATALATFLVVVAGGADAHFTTPAGNEWGWREDGTFVNNLPGLQAVPILGSPTNSTRSIPVFLPISNGIPDIDIQMRDTNANIFHVAAGGTMLQLETAVGQPGLSNRIRLGAVSNQLVSFRFTPQTASSNFTPKVGFVISNKAHAAFQWMGLSGEGGRAQEFRARKDRRAVEYYNETTRPTTHYLRLDAVDGVTSNNSSAMFGPFTVPTGAVHSVVLHDWPRTRQARSELDLNADGVPEEVTLVTGTEIDSDGDGMPDAWETLHQLNPLSADCDDGPDGDPDHDGVNNLGEYLSGTDPHDAASALRLTATLLAGNKVRLSWTAVPGRRYEVLYAESFEYVFRVLPGAGFPRVATATKEGFDDALPAGAMRFYRLRLVP